MQTLSEHKIKLLKNGHRMLIYSWREEKNTKVATKMSVKIYLSNYKQFTLNETKLK